MKLLRLELQDVKRYAGPARSITFDPRATVLHGPNEAGKSTLFEAVRRALFDRSRTQARWVERLVPYGGRALPSVRLEFEHAGRMLRVEKRFGAKGDATLSERRAGADWTRLAANEEAEELLLSTLGATASAARDGAPPESWGAFQWLWMPQELRALPDVKSEATRHLGLEAAGVSDRFESVRRLVLGRHGETFTATGREATHSELAGVKRRIEELEKQHAEAAGEVERLAGLRRRHDEKAEELPRALEDARLAKQEWEAAQSEAEGLADAKGEHLAAVEARRGAEERARNVDAILKERLRLEKTATETEAKRQIAVSEHIKAKEQFELLDRLWSQAREDAGRLGESATRVRKSALDAERSLNLRNARREVQALRELQRRIADADARVATARAAAGEEPPKPALVSRAQEMDSSIRERRAASRVAALRVAVEGQPGLRVLVDERDMAGGEAVALDAVIVEAPGGRVVIRGDTAQAQRLADEAADQERQLAALLLPFGVQTVDELRGLREERLRRRAEHDAVRKEREAIDARATDEIQGEIARLDAQVEEAARSRASAGVEDAERAQAAAGGAIEIDALSEEALRAAVRRLDGEAREADKLFEEARKLRERRNKEHEEGRKRYEDASRGRERAEAEATAAAAALDAHRDAHGSTDRCRAQDDEARQALNRAARRETTAAGEAQRIARDADTRRESTRRKYVRLDEAARTLDASIREMAETLDRESVRGAYSRLGHLERTLEAERSRRDRLQLAAGAVSHLRDVMEDVRREVVRRVVAPIKSDLDEMIAAATLGRYSSVASLDDALRPGTLEGGARCEFEDGSQGLRELVATLLRLAVATHLAKTEPQTVILDDPCVHVSRERTARLVEIMNQRAAGGRLQIVVLTHRGNEFLGLLGSDIDVASL